MRVLTSRHKFKKIAMTQNTSRRDILKLGALGIGAAMLGGCSRMVRRAVPVGEVENISKLPLEKVAPAYRILNRVAFGARPGEAEKVAKIGIPQYVEEQLHPDDDDERVLALRLRSVEVFETGARELYDMHERHVLAQLQTAAILRAVYSRHQLRERMTDFWSNHFNIYARKNYGSYYTATDQTEVIRHHALGKFPQLLKASAQSPAMLIYLDNVVNESGVPNENYARELMELHTLGVRGGYTQRDVKEVARCFTGWTVEDRFLRRRGTFRFDQSRHDDGEKIVLSHKIPAGGGQNDAMRVLNILANHPATAKFIAGKICRYFLGYENRDWTQKLAQIYLRTHGDIKAMLKPLLLSDDLLHAPPIIKRPFDFLVSSLRVLNADTDGGAVLQTHLAKMGQPLYQWPMPDGYPDTTQAWTGSLLARWNFALSLCANEIGGTTVDIEGILRAKNVKTNATFSNQTEALSQVILAQSAPPFEYSHRANLGAQNIAALLLCSPQFQWR
jgi:hypothetical protein